MNEHEAIFHGEHTIDVAGIFTSITLFRDMSAQGALFAIESEGVDLAATDKVWSPHSGAILQMVGLPEKPGR